MKKKILFYDIETSPNTSYTWGKYEQDVIEFKHEWELLSFAYKWLEDSKATVYTRLDFKDSTDRSLTKELWKILDQAEIVIGHNSVDFDNKKARAKFVEHGLIPPSPFKSVDTKLIARQHFKFNSNKLDDLGSTLKVGRKIKMPGGFDVWKGCMKGDKKSFSTLAKYNKQDVILLEKVYKKLLPWMSKHPNMNLINGGQHACPNCGGHRHKKRGMHRTTAGLFQRYQCLECGAWSKDTKPVLKHKIGRSAA